MYFRYFRYHLASGSFVRVLIGALHHRRDSTRRTGFILRAGIGWAGLLLQDDRQPPPGVDSLRPTEAAERDDPPAILQVVLEVLLGVAVLVRVGALDPLLSHVGVVVEVDGHQLLHGKPPDSAAVVGKAQRDGPSSNRVRAAGPRPAGV